MLCGSSHLGAGEVENGNRDYFHRLGQHRLVRYPEAA